MSKVTIRKVQPSDKDELTTRYDESKNFLAPWIYKPEDMEHVVTKSENLMLVVESETGKIAGFYNIAVIIRGYLQQAFLGYAAFVPFNNKGYMSEGLKLTLEYVFKDLELHRLEANIQPGNEQSINLVSSNGFIKEGYSENYLKVNGEWKDHERWAITYERWEEFNANIKK